MGQQRAAQVDALYRDAVALADRTRSWFDGPGVGWRAGLPPAAGAAVAIESLAITARLMAAMAWLLDPAHRRGDRPMPVYALAEAVQGPAPPVLAGSPAMELAVASRQLVAQIADLARGPADAPATRPAPPEPDAAPAMAVVPANETGDTSSDVPAEGEAGISVDKGGFWRL